MTGMIQKHLTPPSKMTDKERRELEEWLNKTYVNGSATSINIPLPLLVETGDYKQAHICMVIRDQMLRNAQNGKCIFRGHVWAKIGIRSFGILTNHLMSEQTIRNAVKGLEEGGYIRRRIMYNPEKKSYEETMYTLTDRAMTLTDTNPGILKYAEEHGEEMEEQVIPEEKKEEKKEEKEEKKPERKPDKEHGYVLIQSLLFPFVPREYKILAADFDAEDRRDADAAMLEELKKRGYDNPKKYIK